MKNRNKIELHPDSMRFVIFDMQVEGCEWQGPGVKPVVAAIRQSSAFRFIAETGRTDV